MALDPWQRIHGNKEMDVSFHLLFFWGVRFKIGEVSPISNGFPDSF